MIIIRHMKEGFWNLGPPEADKIQELRIEEFSKLRALSEELRVI
jgi:hypothetical protein